MDLTDGSDRELPKQGKRDRCRKFNVVASGLHYLRTWLQRYRGFRCLVISTAAFTDYSYIHSFVTFFLNCIILSSDFFLLNCGVGVWSSFVHCTASSLSAFCTLLSLLFDLYSPFSLPAQTPNPRHYHGFIWRGGWPGSGRWVLGFFTPWSRKLIQ